MEVMRDYAQVQGQVWPLQNPSQELTTLEAIQGNSEGAEKVLGPLWNSYMNSTTCLSEWNGDTSGGVSSFDMQPGVRYKDGKVKLLSYNLAVEGSPLYITGKELKPIKKAWDELLDRINAQNPEGNAQLQFVSKTFQRIEADEALFRSAEVTPGVSGLLVFCCVLLVVGSPRIAVAIAITIFCCTMLAFFVFYASGWGLGSIEGLCATILVGLNVDYTVHVALKYVAAQAHDRQGRVTEALQHMGPTVLRAAATTSVSSLLLIPCQIVAFYRVGVVMAVNTLAGAVLALTLFPALLLLFGPEGELTMSPWGRCLVLLEGKSQHSAPPSDSSVPPSPSGRGLLAPSPFSSPTGPGTLTSALDWPDTSEANDMSLPEAANPAN